MASLTAKKQKAFRLPGFKLSFGFTIFYVSLLILLPLSMILLHSLQLTWGEFWTIISDPRAVASYKLTIGASLVAALINVVFGTIIAWVLVRYTFPLKSLMDGLVDLPFALPTAVAGIALTALYAPNGWIGQFFDFKIAFTPLGIMIALTFIGLPFVVRTVQPVLESFRIEEEEASASLGANRMQTIRHVIFPTLIPAIMTGFTLAFARALGEYGSVVFIAGNMPMKTEITPLFIMTKLEQYDYVGATAIASVMLIGSFFFLLTMNIIQWLIQRKYTKRVGA
ncbi:sulfate ABC transporter permease subunit CysT [Kurthia gibsonii]|uniref:sulfate ABC transporter permease subunit CysT n=1 Tax=Kurthia TaxID=1649 RepID=UPI000EB397F2|nr:sulfate ABC transporter permease subunit CysT [Kurthia gibsonii]MEB6111905.1 sulfate ABC transporter permease subunit CysT [Kurthia gibsonii]RXH53551.1 sulfate ABC transporter permease subunit CysT [Kurthia gibsonii]HZG11821.1 sulfate ABC transporter permease subunit CysT [Kurthia gibsonii]